MIQDLSISSHSDRIIETELEDHCPKVESMDINAHKEVIPFANGCVYFVEEEPVFANGIPSDLMVNGLKVVYHPNLQELSQGNETVVAAINKLLFTIANGNIDNLAFLLCYIGSGVTVVTPPKKALLLLDQGGGGKTTLHGLSLISAAGKYVLRHLKHFCDCTKHICYCTKHFCYCTTVYS